MLPEETRRAVLSNPALQSVVRMLLAAIDRQVGVVTDPAQQSAALDLSIILALYIAKERGWTAFGTLRGGPVVIN